MDIAQVDSMAAALDQMQLRTEIGNTVLKKAINSQSDTALTLLESAPALPSNPAIGRNINVTA
ncbi:YjfB family protein [Enterobacteriaceae bacterium BIT-l23]|nr:YjfB family protein [Enterobacteriaceae bacterium BIT-l23]